MSEPLAAEEASSSTMSAAEQTELAPKDEQAASPFPMAPETPACLVLGMAGSGKTTLVDALSGWLEDEEDIELPSDEADGAGNGEASRENDAADADKKPGPTGAYVVNLDPAVHSLPYEPNVDIRDTLVFKDVMKEYSLGPNGAIITSLNLYATKFDQVLSLIEKRAPEVLAVLFDTPGQIETFTWSASGRIITEALAVTMPTVVLFVVDTERSKSAMTFVSNMLYACSIMYKTMVPMVIVFNKIDVTSCKFAQAWMEDFDAFDAALKEENFVGTLARSMAMALEEFYKNMRSVGVSAYTGEGMAELADAIRDAAEEYEREYKPAMEERKRIKAEAESERVQEQVDNFSKDRDSEPDTKWAPRNVDKDKDDSSAEEEDEDVPAGDSVHDVRLRKLKGEDIDDKEEKEAYEDFVRYLDALNIKKKG